MGDELAVDASNGASILKESLANIQRRVKLAADQSHRDSGGIRIVAITKNVDAKIVGLLSDIDWRDIGENRVPDGAAKAQQLPGNRFTWHMVGHLQTNKVRKAVAVFEYIHSLDSLHLAREIQQEAERVQRFIQALIQVNVSGELTKGGIKPEELLDFYRELKKIAIRDKPGGLIISGLMTMAPITDNPATTRPYFRKLRELLDELKSHSPETAAEDLKYLSMGMSQDFEVAVAEGANMLRIGTAIFEPVVRALTVGISDPPGLT
jgi:pyridoxal phosphate enzyme (YggS family)